MLYKGEKLEEVVNAAYEESSRLGGSFTRQAVAGYCVIRGISYDSKELSALVKKVKEENNVTSSRLTFKEKTIMQIGETIFSDDELRGYLLDNEVKQEEVEATVAKYRRYLEVSNRAYQKGLAEAADNNKKAS